jgi:hypothetical protein
MTTIMPLFEKHYPAEDPELFCPYIEYALYCHDVEKTDSSKKYFKLANQIGQNSFNSRHPYLKLLKQKEASCKMKFA